MISNDEYKRAWDQRVGETTAHLKFDDTYLPKDSLYEAYQMALWGMDLTGKTIIDYGCGGGLFAEWLFLYHNVAEYHGIDISMRSITSAVQRLGNYQTPKDVYSFQLIDPDEIDFNTPPHEVFFCLSVIQHMPDKEYLDKFLDFVNQGKFRTLSLQIRHSDKTEFRAEPYKTTHDIALACRTNAEYLQEKLTGYTLKEKSMIAKNGYQYLLFTRKGRGRRRKA